MYPNISQMVEEDGYVLQIRHRQCYEAVLWDGKHWHERNSKIVTGFGSTIQSALEDLERGLFHVKE